MLELGIRLSAVGELVKPGNVIADIGCDHGYLSIALVQNHKAKRMIACDINKGPLAAAEKNIRTCNLSEQIELRLSDGFEKAQAGECDGAILAGMGGPLGLRILYDGKSVMKGWKQIILQLQNSSCTVCLKGMGLCHGRREYGNGGRKVLSDDASFLAEE